MLAYVRSQGGFALAVASSGIASTLLKGGQTAHSRFKIPLVLHETSTCSINKSSDLAKLLKETRLIVWDEAPMLHKHAFEAVDRTFKDIMSSSLPFGGIPIVFGGDFRQLLPVVRRGSRAEIVDATMIYSSMWGHVEQHRLTINMRVMSLEGQDAKIQEWFANFLLRVGDGREATYDDVGLGYIRLPDEMCMESQDVEDLIDTTFPDILRNCSDAEYWTSRAVLTPLNDDVDDINMRVTERLPGDARIFLSADRCIEDEDAATYPIEFLNAQNPSGMPRHNLTLKIGMIVMLIRSISSRLGLCNGTRLIIRQLGSRVIDAEVVSGKHPGMRVFIPRIPLNPNDSDLPFAFERLQFPIRPAFAMTINKAQGQTMRQVGLYLPNPVFSHGQLYVALSRVQSLAGVKALIVKSNDRPDGHKFTANVVYFEVFQDRNL